MVMSITIAAVVANYYPTDANPCGWPNMPLVGFNLIVKGGRIVIPHKLVEELKLGTGMVSVVINQSGRLIRFRALLVIRDGVGYITIPSGIRDRLGIGDGVAVRVISIDLDGAEA